MNGLDFFLFLQNQNPFFGQKVTIAEQKDFDD
jgi:hypothetical protein